MRPKTRTPTAAVWSNATTRAVALPLWAALGLAALMAFAQSRAHAQAAPAPAKPTPEAIAANRQAETAFLRADTNSDGKLSRQEAERLPAIAERFDQIDTNHDQFLSLEEFNKVAAM